MNSDAWNSKGAALKKLGRVKEAKGCIEAAIDANPMNADAWYNKGCILAELGKHRQAVECYDKAIEINPKYAEAWHNKGVALVKIGEYEKAIEAFENCIKYIKYASPEHANEVEDLKRYVEQLKEKVRRKNRTSNKARLN